MSNRIKCSFGLKRMNLRNTCKTQIFPVIFLLCFFAQTSLASNNSGFQPKIDIQLQREDNVRRAPKQSKQSDSILILKMDLPLRWNFGKHKLDLTYKSEYAEYADQKVLNYNDHQLSSRLLLDHSYRLNTEYELGYIREHDMPDDNNIVANRADKPSQWKEKYVQANLLYGTSSSPGEVITQLKYRQRDYTNNKQKFLNSNRTSLSGTFHYRITPKTRIPFELNIINYDYQNSTPITNPSSTEYRYLTGISWDATVKSDGILQLGFLEKKYDNSRYNDISIFVLRLDAAWRPNTFTKLVFGVVRDVTESLQISSSAYIQNYLHTSVSHIITPRTTLFFGTRYTISETDDFIAVKNTGFNAQFKARHSLRRWLYVGISYRHIGRDSDINNLDFKTNIFMFEIQTQFNN